MSVLKIISPPVGEEIAFLCAVVILPSLKGDPLTFVLLLAVSVISVPVKFTVPEPFTVKLVVVTPAKVTESVVFKF